MKAVGIASLASLAMMAVAGSAGAQRRALPIKDQSVTEQRAPKGMCRVWLKDVPPAQQPAPTDCAAAIKNCPTNGKVIFGDTEETKSKPKVEPQDSTVNSPMLPGIKALAGKPPALKKKPPE